jgi:hypothetical protein
MLTIQLEVSEELAEKVGLETLIERFKQDMELEKLRLLAEKIQKGIHEAGLDNEFMVKKARHKAWQNFKDKNLKDVLG